MRPVMACADVEELLGAYALGALSDAERARVEEHLRTCTEHQVASEELLQVTPLLAMTVDEREASPELRQRILDALSREPQLPRPQPTVAASQPPVQATPRRRQLPRRSAALAAAAVILLAVGAAIGHFTTQPAPSQVVAYTFAGNSLAPQAQAHLVYFKNQRQAVVEVTGLPALTPSQVYEMWLFQGNHPIDAGVAATSGTLVARMDRDLGQYQQFAITVEPGEQQQPTTSPILAGQLQ